MIAYKRNTANPFTFLFLVLPSGVSQGFITVSLPFILTQHGFTVEEAASITALGLSSNIWRFMLAPMTDLSYSLHKWYITGNILCALTLSLLCLIPLETGFMVLLTIAVFISQVAANLIVVPVGGFMAKTIPEEMKGRAGGWYQAGNLGGEGLGGGAGIWLTNHFSYQTALVVLSMTIIVCSFALFFIPQIKAEKTIHIRERFRMMAVDIKSLLRSPVAIFTMAVIVLPIGIGAASNLWSSVANDWHVKPDTIALVTGTLSAFACVAGSVAGGWIADKWGRWLAYFGAGILMASVTLGMTFFAYNPETYVTGVLSYAFTFGLANAAFSAIVLHAIGRGMASTKYALLSSLGNVPYPYMTLFDGWLHDAYGIRMMLFGETLLGTGFVIIMIFVLAQLRSRKIQV
ncbi:MAG: MFS transporter [Bacteroidota bacterium]|nr:MFS transporter [Bacteroidota bacterium]